MDLDWTEGKVVEEGPRRESCVVDLRWSKNQVSGVTIGKRVCMECVLVTS